MLWFGSNAMTSTLSLFCGPFTKHNSKCSISTFHIFNKNHFVNPWWLTLKFWMSKFLCRSNLSILFLSVDAQPIATDGLTSKPKIEIDLYCKKRWFYVCFLLIMSVERISIMKQICRHLHYPNIDRLCFGIRVTDL